MAETYKYNPLMGMGLDITGSGEVVSKNDVDNALSLTSTNPVQNKVIAAELQAIRDKMDELHYVSIVVSSFSVNPSVAEKGNIVKSVTLSWSINKNPKYLEIEGDEQENPTRSGSLTINNLNLQSAKDFSIKVRDDKNVAASKSTRLQFFNGVYYGVNDSRESYDSNFILALTKNLQNSRAKTFTVAATAGQYIYYAVPVSYGACGFNVGGFDGGFRKVATINFTNACGHTENYDIYRSDNAGLGTTTVKVS